MNIKELKEIIKHLPDLMEIGDTGHFGEMLHCDSIYVEEIEDYSISGSRNILIIKIESPGEAPE